jgi:hypothetical protein
VNGEDATVAEIEVGMFLVAEGAETGDNAIDAVRVAAGDDGFRGGKGFRFGGPGWGEPDSDSESPEATGSAS